jgi:hypothetical protein
MDAEDPGSLRFVVAGGGEDFLDIFVFQFAQADQLAAGGGDVEIRREVGGFLLFSANGADVAIRARGARCLLFARARAG